VFAVAHDNVVVAGNSVAFTLADPGSFRGLLPDPVVDVDTSNASGC
jgi:hypothetical protein